MLSSFCDEDCKWKDVHCTNVGAERVDQRVTYDDDEEEEEDMILDY